MARVPRFLLLIPFFFAAGLALAGEALPVAADPELEARVSRLAEELRCLVCQNQTLADSHAPLALDLKNQVREMLASGRDEKDVVEYMVTRYGDFVLYRPPLKATTLLLWTGPLLLLLASLYGLHRQIRLMGRDARRDCLQTAVDAQAARRADALLGLASPKERP